MIKQFDFKTLKNDYDNDCSFSWEFYPNGILIQESLAYFFLKFNSKINQVWAGNEACEPVTWQECKLVPKTVSFIVPEITCNVSYT